MCVEPNPELFKQILKKRPRDVALNVGISSVASGNADYYVMTSKFLNTFSKEEAEQYTTNKELQTPQKIEKVIKIPLVTINSIMEEYFPEGVDILSVDTEGYDLEILKSLNFAKYPAKIICVETLRHDEQGNLQKSPDINAYIVSQGYSFYADTRVNSIFVKK